MPDILNQNPKQLARDKIGSILRGVGWVVLLKNKANLAANVGVAVREYQIDVGPADYVLFVDRIPVGIIEAKRGDEGHRLTMVEDQASNYLEVGLLINFVDTKLKFHRLQNKKIKYS